MMTLPHRRGAPVALALFAATLVLSPPRVVRAQEPPSAPWSERDRARLAFLDDTLERDAAESRRWFWRWLGVFALAEGGQLTVLAAASDRGTRAGSAVGAVVTGIGIVASIATAPPTLFASRSLPSSGATRPEQTTLLEERERLLERARASESLGRSVLAHLAGVAINGAGALYLGLQENEPVRGALGFAVGVTVAEVRIWTQPTTAMRAATATDGTEKPGPEAIRVDVAPMVTRDATGLMLLGRF